MNDKFGKEVKRFDQDVAGSKTFCFNQANLSQLSSKMINRIPTSVEVL